VCISFSFQRKAELKYTKKAPSLQGRSKTAFVRNVKYRVFAGVIWFFFSVEGSAQRTL
jgi:hypothetical protein